MRESFVFYNSFLEAIEELEPETQLKMFLAITKYALRDEKMELNKMEQAMFKLMKPNIDKAILRYDTNVENGQKGGAPKGNTNAKKQPNSTQNNPKQPNHNPIQPKNNHNDNDNVNDNYNDNDNVDVEEDENLNLLLPPPSLSQVVDYVNEKNLNVDAQRFYDYYEASGWIDKDGQTISNWKQKLLNWSKSEKKAEVNISQDLHGYAEVVDFDKYISNLNGEL